MSWLLKLAGGRLMLFVYGAAAVAILGYYTQIKVLNYKIAKRDTTIAELGLSLVAVEKLRLLQNKAVEGLEIEAEKSKAYNAGIAKEHTRETIRLERQADKAKARLQAALKNNDCASQQLPDSIRNEF